MKKIYFQDGENYDIQKDKVVKATKYKASGDIEILDTSNQKNGFDGIEKISKYEYYDLKSNTTKLYKISGPKSKVSLRKSMKCLEKKLKNNFLGGKNELFVTLTTDIPITDIEEMKYYFKVFWDKLKSLYDGLEYAYIIEMQDERNSWHFHLLLKDMKNKILYIPNSTIEKLWNKGHTKTSRITNNTKKHNNIDEAEYIDSIENTLFYVDETFRIDKVISYMIKTRTKQKIPKGTRCYDTSRGLKSPEIENVIYSEICSQMEGNYELKKEKTLLIRNTDTKAIVNKVKKETWKKIKQ